MAALYISIFLCLVSVFVLCWRSRRETWFEIAIHCFFAQIVLTIQFGMVITNYKIIMLQGGITGFWIVYSLHNLVYPVALSWLMRAYTRSEIRISTKLAFTLLWLLMFFCIEQLLLSIHVYTSNLWPTWRTLLMALPAPLACAPFAFHFKRILRREEAIR